MNIAWPEGTSDTIATILDTIGRNVDFYTETSVSGCSSCGVNPITNEPLDPFCTTCSGIYWIPSYAVSNVTCHITWKDADRPMWVTGGEYYEGDCKVKFSYSLANYNLATGANHLIVDNRRMKLGKIVLLGVPNINRIIVHATEEEKEDG